MTASLTRAGPAEILRAAQKDESFREKLRNLLFEISLQVGGTRVLVKYRDLISASGNLLYYGTTTLSGLQTLGEEYTGIIQFDTSQSNIPSFRKRLLMILLSEFGQKLTHLLLVNLQHNYYLKDDKSSIRLEARQQLIKAVIYLKLIVSFLERFHKAIFYWTGYYGQLSKRMTGIQYVLVRYWLKNRESLYGFKLLSIVTMLQTLIYISMKSLSVFNESSCEQNMHTSTNTESLAVLPNKRCPLCLDERKNVSVTPCGHLFCWYCILEWVQNEQKCPVCRETVIPSRIVPLQHYV